MPVRGDVAMRPEADALPPMAALEVAADWFLRLRAGELSETDLRELEAWRSADPANDRAWQRAELLARTLDSAPRNGSAALDTGALAPRRTGRRRAVATLGLLLALLSLHWMPWPRDPEPWQTRIGEQHEFTLPDGGSALLNTASVAEVDYSPWQRTLRLQRGELLVDTAPDAAGWGRLWKRPFVVEAGDARLVALGTRFAVRVVDGQPATLTVLAGRVRMEPAGNAPAVVVAAGQTLALGTGTAVVTARPADTVWAHGVLLADDQPLCEFLHELARYRARPLECDPGVQARRISGAFPVADPDAVLTALTTTLPVKTVESTAGATRVLPR